MTYKELSDLIETYNIPEDVKLNSDSGWEIDATNMDGVFYNPKENMIVFTQCMDDTRYMYDKKPWVKLDSWKLKVKEAYIEYENESTYIDAYKINDELYIVHGEMAIYGFDQNFNRIWDIFGSDIFVTQDDTPAVNFTEEYILVSDWEGEQYKIGYDGNPIIPCKNTHTIKCRRS